MNLTAAKYDRLSGDATLVALLGTYAGGPAPPRPTCAGATW